MNSNIGLADSAGSGRAGGSNGHRVRLAGEALNDASAFTGMEELASSTGGRAFTTNDIGDALHKIVHDSDVYYTVGYAPTDSAEDGSFRRIDVKVSGGKYKLAYRQGYNASEPGAAPAENPIAPLLQLGIPNATGIYYGAGATHQCSDRTTAPETAGQNPQLNGPLTRYTVSFTIRAQDRLLRTGAQRRAHRQTSRRRQGLRRKRRCAQLAGHAGSRRALCSPVPIHPEVWHPRHSRSRPARQHPCPARYRRIRLEYRPLGNSRNACSPIISKFEYDPIPGLEGEDLRDSTVRTHIGDAPNYEFL